MHPIPAISSPRSLARPSTRALRVAVLAATAILSWLLVAGSAPAASNDLTQGVLDARKAVGLPAIKASPAVKAAAGAMIAGKDPKAAFASSGGTGKLVTATAPTGGALSTATLKAVVFDPRLSAISVLGSDRIVAVTAVLDPQRPFSRPVLAGATVDPGVPGSLAVLFPPRSGTIPTILLQRYRGKQLTTIDVAATAVPGLDGAILVGLKGRDRITGPQIGYGLTYKLTVGANAPFTFQTRPLPAVLIKRSFVSGPGFSGDDRQRFLKTVDALPPNGRRIVDIIGGAITVRVLDDSTSICRAQTSCAGYDPGRGYFLILNRAQLRSPIGRFVITHELGHLVDFLGLDTFSQQVFKDLFTRSSKWRACYPLNGSCSPFLEVFADQFGFFSTNAVGVQSGYGDDRLATGPAFNDLLRIQWAFRPPQDRNPLAGFGPLSQSFEQAMHSGEDAL